MWLIVRKKSPFAFVLVCLVAVLLPQTALAFDRYSLDGGNSYCASCHGDFRSSNYISLADGQLWGNLHNIHRNNMLDGDCNACHIVADGFPTLIDQSIGGEGLTPIGCMGCHGREEDNVASNPSFPFGRGAGLRQHHTNAGVDNCLGCHDDADPANYTPVGEKALPPFFADPGTGHDNMPADSCNDDGSENFAGLPNGLDNDGDLDYDLDDPSCGLSAVPGATGQARLLQNHPNPFNPVTRIEYVLDRPGHVLLQVYSVSGDLVRTLVNARHDQAASYQVSWNGRDEGGRPQPSGIFFYRLETAGAVEMKKMVLLK